MQIGKLKARLIVGNHSYARLIRSAKCLGHMQISKSLALISLCGGHPHREEVLQKSVSFSLWKDKPADRSWPSPT